MVGGNAAGDQNRFIDAALAAGVKRFVPSKFGPYSRDPKFSELMPAVLPAKAGRALGFDLASKTVTFIDGGTSVVTTTTLSTVGKALVAMLEHPDETKNTYVFVSSFNISQRDILEVVEMVDGQKWTIKHITPEEVIASGKRKLAAGDFAGIMDLVRGGACGKQGLGDSRPYGLWNNQLGLPKEDIEKAIRYVFYGV
ncbi:uncharacterized protein P174DRAFT_426301 [Aspergillus novofumigatus IBT 16806]|uniref:Uncharacterized protein n=1 Tax=Aspergillus novofumigatus (strain IBT 16806) TaxID=1392255 RepID=A0A2I1CJZ6_ASPN1|nr:uncharacterized protein P174DRAFT_426301 [Aspergillus novofumigatus IBT 16806]PKX97949.1 hypothetical protein P174DRAFT_426301 [Aspergillus novofumigatus IBT 16806]